MRLCVSCHSVSGRIDNTGRCSFCAEPVAPLPVPVGPEIVAAVARESGHTVEALRGGGRTRALSQARWAAMLVLREAGWSTPRIGRLLGNRDHTTVLHGLSKIRNALAGPDGDRLRSTLDAARAAAGTGTARPYSGPPVVMVWGEPPHP